MVGFTSLGCWAGLSYIFPTQSILYHIVTDLSSFSGKVGLAHPRVMLRFLYLSFLLGADVACVLLRFALLQNGGNVTEKRALLRFKKGKRNKRKSNKNGGWEREKIDKDIKL